MRVVFLTSHPDGMAAYSYLLRCGSDAEVVHAQFDGKFDVLPPYDLGISFLYNYKIPASELTPDHTWVNFHPAPLPEYRGRNVAYHAIMNGGKNFGATLHYVDTTFDTGDIIDVYLFEIENSDTAGDLAQRARYYCMALFQDYIGYLLNGVELESSPQGEGRYYPKQPIESEVWLTTEQQRQVRAITAPPYYPHIMIGGKKYVIRPE